MITIATEGSDGTITQVEVTFTRHFSGVSAHVGAKGAFGLTQDIAITHLGETLGWRRWQHPGGDWQIVGSED